MNSDLGAKWGNIKLALAYFSWSNFFPNMSCGPQVAVLKIVSSFMNGPQEFQNTKKLQMKFDSNQKIELQKNSIKAHAWNINP